MTGTVMVVGSLHYDVVVTAPRLPQTDETLPGSAVHYVAGGKGGNQAVAASRHGARTVFAGRIGSDAPGLFLRDHLGHAGCDISGLKTVDGEATGMSVAIVDERGDYGAVIVSGANARIDPDSIDFPPDTACLVLQNEVPEAVNLGLAQRARAKGIRVILNAAPARDMAPALLASIDILVVNRVEAGMISGLPVISREDALAAATALSHLVPEVILTLGGDGVIHAARGAGPVAEPAFRAEVVSTHGAGDAFVGALAAQIADGSDMEAAIRYAQAAASLHVAAPVDRRHLVRPMQVRNRLGED